MIAIATLLAFVAGFLSLALLQLSLLCLLLRHHLHRSSNQPLASTPAPSPLPRPTRSRNDDRKFPPLRLSLQGDIWVAAVSSSDSGTGLVKNVEVSDKPSKESRKKRDGAKDLTEVHPVRMLARLEGHSLVIKADEGNEEAINLNGCDVRAVSGGSELSRKWAKKYPIRLQSANRFLYAQSSTLLIYLETGWEKEIWCQVLRAASGLGSYTEDKYIGMKEEFDYYCQQLNEVYPALWLLQPDYGHQPDEKREISKPEAAGVSKKRQFWRKLTRKSSSKGSNCEGNSGVGYGESNHKVQVVQSQVHGGGLQEKADDFESPDGSTMNLERTLSKKVCTTDVMRENGWLGDSFASMKSDNRASSTADICADSNNGSLNEASTMHMPRNPVDQGTLCWNILFSRLFFDLHHSDKLKAVCKQLIEKQISKVTIPSYIGSISCTNLDLGAIPPFLYRMHALPMNEDGEWAVEADLDYTGGALLTIETRLDVCDSISQEKVVNQSFEPTLAGAAAADLLKSVEEDLETDRVVTSQVKISGSSSGPRVSKISKSTNRVAWVQSSKARLRSMLSHVAEQVSQVPLTLSVRVVSLKGTLRICIRSPPSDRIWFGFLSMPDIELQPEPSIGDHKISTGPLADFIANRIKISVNDTLVLPNSQDISIPEMISERDDWLPQAAVPLPWSPIDRSLAISDVQAGTLQRSTGQSSRQNQSDTKPVTNKQTSFVLEAGQKFPDPPLPGPTSSITSRVLTESGLMDYNSDLVRPLLEKIDPQSEEECEQEKMQVLPSSDNELTASSETLDEGKRKQGSKRTKMINLGKRVSERLDEKRRNVLEKVREGLEKSEYGSSKS